MYRLTRRFFDPDKLSDNAKHPSSSCLRFTKSGRESVEISDTLDDVRVRPSVGHLAQPCRVPFLLTSAVFAGIDELLAVHP